MDPRNLHVLTGSSEIMHLWFTDTLKKVNTMASMHKRRPSVNSPSSEESEL